MNTYRAYLWSGPQILAHSRWRVMVIVMAVASGGARGAVAPPSPTKKHHTLKNTRNENTYLNVWEVLGTESYDNLDQVRTRNGFRKWHFRAFKVTGGACPQTPLVTRDVHFACLPAHKFLATAMIVNKLIWVVCGRYSVWSVNQINLFPITKSYKQGQWGLSSHLSQVLMEQILLLLLIPWWKLYVELLHVQKPGKRKLNVRSWMYIIIWYSL